MEPHDAIRRLARRYLRAKDRFTAMDTDEDIATDLEREFACREMLTTRTRLVGAVLNAVGCALDSRFSAKSPAVVDVGRWIIAVAESPEDEGIKQRMWDPALIVIRKDRIVRLGCRVVRA